MNTIKQDLEIAKAALEEATKEYKRTYTVWLNLPSGTNEKADADRAVTFAEKAKSEAQARVKDLLEEKKLNLEEMKLAQGKFVFPFHFYFEVG
jgi:exonuclease VII small subunit